jgi:hypothetical protein
MDHGLDDRRAKHIALRRGYGKGGLVHSGGQLLIIEEMYHSLNMR